MKKSVSCREFRAQSTHFQADELPAETYEALREHLDGCPECSARLAVDDALLRGLKRRLERVPAPPGLETRVRAALAAQAPSSRGLPWFRRSWVAAAAAAVLLAVLLFPGPGSGRLYGDPEEIIKVRGQRVMVVDRDCDSSGRSIRQQKNCRHPKHLNALKVESGRYWNLSLDQESGREILLDPRLRGKRLVVDGDLFTGIRTLRMSRFEVVEEVTSTRPSAPLRSAAARD